MVTTPKTEAVDASITILPLGEIDEAAIAGLVADLDRWRRLMGKPKAPLTHNTRPAFLCHSHADRADFIHECASFHVCIGAAIALSRKIDPDGEGHYFTSIPIYCEPYTCRDGVDRQPPAGEIWLLSAPCDDTRYYPGTVEGEGTENSRL